MSAQFWLGAFPSFKSKERSFEVLTDQTRAISLSATLTLASMVVSYIHEVNCVVVHQSICNHDPGVHMQLLVQFASLASGYERSKSLLSLMYGKLLICMPVLASWWCTEASYWVWFINLGRSRYCHDHDIHTFLLPVEPLSPCCWYRLDSTNIHVCV